MEFHINNCQGFATETAEIHAQGEFAISKRGKTVIYVLRIVNRESSVGENSQSCDIDTSASLTGVLRERERIPLFRARTKKKKFFFFTTVFRFSLNLRFRQIEKEDI